jgi:signal transduction histidine kinase
MMAIGLLLSFREAVADVKPTVVSEFKAVPVGDNIEYLADPGSQLTLSTLLTRPDGFTPLPKGEVSFGFNTTPHWFHVAIENPNDETIALNFEINYPLLDFIEFYVLDENHNLIKQWKTGDRYPFQERPIKHVNFIFPLLVNQKSVQHIYMRVQTNGSLQVPMIIWHNNQFNADATTFYMAQGLWIGAMLILTVYNTFLLLSVWNISYLYYVLHILGLILYISMMKGFSFQYLFPDDPNLVNNMMITTMGITNILATLFSINFLSIKRTSRIMSGFLWFLVAYGAILSLAGVIIPYKTGIVLAAVLCIINFGGVLVVGVLRLIKGQREAVYFVAAWVAYSIAAVFYGLAKLGYIPLYFFIENGPQIGSIFEGALLSFAMGDKLKTLTNENEKMALENRRAQEELLAIQKEHIATLDRKVEEKTKTIKIILKNVKYGFLLINDKLEIQPGFTESCHQLFNKQIAPATLLTDYLTASEREMETFLLAIEQVFEDSLPEVVTLAQIPEVFRCGSKILSIKGSIIRDAENKAEMILFTIIDKTEQIEAEKMAQINDSLLRIIRNKEAFKLLISDFRQVYQQIAAGSFDHSAARLFLHTLKGNLSCYGLNSLAGLIHGIEDQEEVTASDWERIKQHLELFCNTYQKITEISMEQELLAEQEITLPFTMVDHMYHDLKKQHRLSDWNASVEGWFANIIATPIKVLVNQLPLYAETLAGRLGKKVHVEILAEDIRVSDPLAINVVKNLVHLVRNAIDHGIEFPEARGVKPQTGLIHISFEKSEKALAIKIQDDGRGFDFPKLRKRLVEKGLIAKDKTLSHQEIVRLAISSAVSSSDEISEVSGRGVGLKAVFDQVFQAGGTLEVQSEPGAFTIIFIAVPLHAQVRYSHFRNLIKQHITKKTA